MVLVKAKYKTLLREVCGGVGTDQTCESKRAPVVAIRMAVMYQDQTCFRSSEQNLLQVTIPDWRI